MYVIVGILGLLIGLLFLFVRQKIYSFEHRLNLLSDTIQAIAGLNVQHTIKDEDEDDDEDDEDEEDEEDAEDAEDVEDAEEVTQSFVKTIHLEPLKFEFNLTHLEPTLERVEPKFEYLEPTLEYLEPKLERLEPNLEYLEPHLEHLEPTLEHLEPTLERLEPKLEHLEPKLEHLEPNLDFKVITLERVVSDEIYEKMTVKELKEKVSEVDGPKFKTKKEMVDFLKSR